MKARIKNFISWLVPVIFYICGGRDALLECLILALIFDYLTGIAKAFYLGELSSDKGLKGIVKKCVVITVVVVAHIVDVMLNMSSGAFREIAIYGLTANECLSIIENVSAMGICVPKSIVNKLSQVKISIESKEE